MVGREKIFLSDSDEWWHLFNYDNQNKYHMLLVIINSDDLGISPKVNDAVFDLMRMGKVTSASLLANAPAVEDAATRQMHFPNCSFGVHLNLTEFKPLTNNPELSPLLAGTGEFSPKKVRSIHLNTSIQQAIFHEWMAQIECLRALGVEPSHIDSHHHVHTIPGLFRTLKRVQKASGIYKVRQSMNFYGLQKPSPLLLLKKQLWNLALRKIVHTETTQGFTDFSRFMGSSAMVAKTFRTVELMTHPGSELFSDETDMLETDWHIQLPFEVRLISYLELRE